ncbi:MAG: hypothetical protein WCA98_16490, partial [Candidatus Acidiferrales bacterium]
LLQHPNDLLFTKAASFHDPSPLAVLYPEKLSLGWTIFRGAGQQAYRSALQSARNRTAPAICVAFKYSYAVKKELHDCAKWRTREFSSPAGRKAHRMESICLTAWNN